MMGKKDLTGIFFYHPGNGHISGLNFQEIISYAENFENITVTWDSEKIQFWDKEFIETQIKKHNICRLIIAGFETGMIKPLFARIFSKMELPMENIALADFAEHGALERNDTELAKSILL